MAFSYPSNWHKVKLSEICTPKQWKTLSTKDLSPAGYPVYGANGVIGYHTTYNHEKPTLLITCRGATCGCLNISEPFSYVNGNAMALDNLAESKTSLYYLHYFFKHTGFASIVSGSAQPQITKIGLEKIHVYLPNLEEQKRIVAKLDRLLARVDSCRAHLDRAAKAIKRFRQSVLNAAVTGQLTETWRAAHNHHLSTYDWNVVKIKDAGRIQLGRQRSPKYHNGNNMRPYLRVQNVFEDRIDLSDVMHMEFSEADFARYVLHPGDILLNEGQSPEFLGRPAMYKGELPGACFTNTLIRFQASENVMPEYALLVFRYQMHSGRYRSEGNITTNIAHLGAGRFAEVEFPLPDIAEQKEIVRQTYLLFSYADGFQAKLTAARQRAENLTASILAKAFRGELL